MSADRGVETFAPVITAIVLAGGRGTRLGSLTDNMPKPLLPVAGVPFLEYVLWNLARWGITEIILSTGWRAATIREYFGDGASLGVHITYAEEPSPLGTGGAVRFAAQALTEPFFVINGDTLLDCAFHALAKLTLGLGAKAGMALREVEDAERFGSVLFSEHRVHGFQGKGISGPGIINGGVYILTPEAIRLLPDGPSSLETELFPLLAKQGDLAGWVCNGFFLDMGLPATYAEAQTLLPQWKDKATIRAVFLDRDGTLIVEKNYLHDPEQIELLPGVVDGLKLLRRHGFALIVVTNQSGVGRGYYSLEAMHAVNKRLGDILRAEGIELDAIYYCPHTPDERCACRKPELGMLRQSIREKGICLSGSFVIGDKEADISLGNNAEMRTVLVRTGYGAETAKRNLSLPSHVSNTLYDAAKWIVQNRNIQNDRVL